MTNLKKVLALSLAATSVLGTVASATFTDSADIDNTDAVNMLSALGIIKGYEDGSFNPEGTVTRAEMAKMIFVIKNGGSDDASAFEDTYSSLNDINGHWAEGHIKFCESLGIIAGKGDGKFDPNAKVTGTEALKMALVTLGYTAERAGLEGTNWSKNTISLSTMNGLTEDVSNFGSDAERQNAAQILYNAINADTVKYNVLSETFEKSNPAVTLAEADMDLSETKGTITAVTKGGFTIQPPTPAGGTAPSPVTFESDVDYTTAIGQKVEVLHKDQKTGNDFAYGITVDEDTKSIVAQKSELKTTASVVTLGDVEITVSNIDAITATSVPSNSTVVIHLNAGETTAVATVTPVSVGKVTYVNKEKIVLSGIDKVTNVEFKDNQVATGLEKDDYVTYEDSVFEKDIIVKAIEAQTGTVSAKKDSEYKVDGNWYTLSGVTSLTLNEEIEFFAVGSVIYAADVIKASDVQSDIVVLSDAAEKLTTSGGSSLSSAISYLEAKIMAADGTETVVKLANEGTGDKDGDAVDYPASGWATPGSLYTYEIIDGYHVLTAVTHGDDKDFSNSAIITSGTSGKGNTFDSSSDDNNKTTLATFTIADDAVFYVAVDKNANDNAATAQDLDFSIVTGKQVKAWDSLAAEFTGSVFTNKVDGFDVIESGALVLNETKLPNEVSDTLYGYVVEDAYEVIIDKDKYTMVTVFNGVENVEYKIEGHSKKAVAGQMIAYKKVASEEIEIVTFASTGQTATLAAVKGYNGSIISLYEGDQVYNMTDDTQIIHVDTDANVGLEGGSISTAIETETTGKFFNNVYIVTNTDNDVVAIYVDSNMEFIANSTPSV